ncbi:hypothetical protein [Streptomyces sp. NPDC058664]|uniref:hypothetical protein n=1 Tax=unclassified Streptomyces TaxID=2593676 RepID=UPI00364AE1DF
MTDLVLKQLRFERARLDYQAEKLRTRQRGMVPTSPAAAAIAKQTREIQTQADSYALLIEKAEEMR